MKTVPILFLLGLTTLIFGEAPTADAASVRTTRDVSNSRSYRKISTLLSGIEKDVKAVKYSILYLKAVKALQEAMTRIETLESKVAALEGS